MSGYFQPVEIRAPDGALILTAVEGAFDKPRTAPLVVGMQLGAVYRLQVTQIPNHPGLEVYPTVEVIDRLFPPPGEVWRFPIPIDLTQIELEMALEGKFVTRVIYLEDPERAIPVATDQGRQSWFEAAPGENPLEVADQLGRPMAILRMGGRVPDEKGPDRQFLFGSPPLLPYAPGDEAGLLRNDERGLND